MKHDCGALCRHNKKSQYQFIEIKDGDMFIDNVDHVNPEIVEISFCPFCGMKIESEA